MRERRRRRRWEASVALADILAERADRARVQRHLALLSLFPCADVHNPPVKIDVDAVQADRFSGSHPGDRQQPDQRLVPSRRAAAV